MANYSFKKDKDGLYIIENTLNTKFILKSESIFAQSNGNIGLRNSLDFRTLEENKGMFIAGFYNKSEENGVSQLVNCPDIINFDISLNNIDFKIDKHVKSFNRIFNILTGETTYIYKCQLETGEKFDIKSARFVSVDNINLVCQNISIKFYDKIDNVKIVSGILGNTTNSGVSHLKNVSFRVHNKEYMESTSNTNEDVLKIVTKYKMKSDKVDFVVDKRKIYSINNLCVEENENIEINKFTYITLEEKETQNIINELSNCFLKGYDSLLDEHKKAYNYFYDRAKIEIEGLTLEEEVKINFAIYHILCMTNKTLDEISIGAKGLTGEGYNGHVFWDTEIFILPFFTFLFPDIAKNLLKFRYYGIDGAKQKALDYGYKGTMYPWEVCKTGYEETPLYSALNIYTGKRTKIYSGIKEHHITADIVYGIYNYMKYTNDDDFMDMYGYEIVFNCANFWASRCQFDLEKNSYVINDVIGPDEYTEHVDNNAYTNYLAVFSIKYALEQLKKLEGKDIHHKLFEKFDIENNKKIWEDVCSKIYLPIPNNDGIIPQDDTFLQKPEIENIEKYKFNPKKQTILLDYSRDEVIAHQVLKQADVVMLFELFPKLFSYDTMNKNIHYYEKRTIHDSSLSYCTHAIASAIISDNELAYKFFENSLDVDVNEHYVDSTDGIHAAGLAGIWNSIVFGFAGIYIDNNCLEIKPNLPKHWESISININLKGEYYKMKISNSYVEVDNDFSFDIKVDDNIKIIRK